MASKDDLYDFLYTVDEDDLPDGAWLQYMEDHTEQFNKLNGTKYDFYEILEGYGEYKGKQLNTKS